MSSLRRNIARVNSYPTSARDPRDVLKTLMAEAGIPSGRQLALLADLDQPSLSRYLSGRTRDMELGTLRKLAAFFGVTLAEILGEAPVSSKTVREAQKLMRQMDESTMAQWVRLGKALASDEPSIPAAGPKSR